MQINMIEDISKQFSNMEYMTTVSKLFAVVLRQVAFYLTVLADLLDENEMIRGRKEYREINEDDFLENKTNCQMRENTEVIEKINEREVLRLNSLEEEICVSNSDPKNYEISQDLQMRTKEHGDSDFEMCEISWDLGRERKDTVLSTDSGIDTVCDEDFLQDFVSGKDPESGLDLICLDEVSYHNTREDAWIVIYDKVFEMTEYLEDGGHPGGEDVILEYLGYDATLAFRGVAHSKSALRFLEKYCIGILPSEERLNFTSD